MADLTAARNLQVVFLALLSNIASAANPTITLQVSSETAPAGGYAQFKFYLTEPARISSAGISIQFDPSIFGSPSSIAAFSATGDQIGWASTYTPQIGVYAFSQSASLGQLPDLPIFVVTVPVLATAKPGASSSITGDSTEPTWQDQQGNTYTVNVNPGTFTVGGALSVQNVIPGAGLVATGRFISIQGTGFDATTTVAIDGVSVASTHLVGTQQIDVTLGGATEMNGKHVHIGEPAGEQVDFFASAQIDYSAAAPGTAKGFSVILPLSYPLMTSADWQIDPSGDYWTSCLQNPNNSPVTANFYIIGPGEQFTIQSVIIPPYGEYVTSSVGFGGNYMTVSAPIRLAELYTNFESESSSLFPAAPLTSLGELGVQFSSPPGPVVFNWQLGTPAPQPLRLGVLSDFPISVSISAGAQSFLQVTPLNGPFGASLAVTPLVSNLSVGTYAGTVTITPQLPPDLMPFGPGSVSFGVTLDVTAQPLLSSGSTLSFSALAGGPASATQTFSATSNGTPAPFTATVFPNSGNWLSVTPASASTPATLTVSVNPGSLAAGLYQSGFTLQGPINSVNIPVTLTLTQTGAAGVLNVAPASLSFLLPPNQVSPEQTINIRTLSPVLGTSLSTQSGGNWLNVFSLPPADVEVYVNSYGLAAGNYQGTVTISSFLNQTATVPVNLTVTSSSAQLSVSPPALALTAPAGASARAIATGALSVSLLSGPPTFTVQATAPQGLQLKIQSNPPYPSDQFTAPATVEITATASLPGTYQGSVEVAWSGGSATIPVTLYATASPSTPPQMIAIVNSGSAMPGAIAPGELITIFGSGLGGASAGGNIATSLNGTQLLINGIAAPLIYSSTGQVNAIVPYEVGAN
jgi:hypothetical protein